MSMQLSTLRSCVRCLELSNVFIAVVGLEYCKLYLSCKKTAAQAMALTYSAIFYFSFRGLLQNNDPGDDS